MDNLTIQLEKPIKIAYQGDLREVEILNVFLPNVTGFNLYADIKSIVTNAMFDLEDKINKNQDDNTSNDDNIDKFPLEIFLASNTVKDLANGINKYLSKFAKWDNEILVNENQLKKLSIQDYNNILEKVSYFLFQI